ncbi:MAG TPA: hypothetical protein VEB64_13295 [Azospirillaceae bacterium]|nr:hypothetical protein [Azospirillaceae bacterium]
MSRTSSSLPTGPLPDVGLDYLALRTEGVRLVQRMSGNVWTDYNFSDPGVTSLEQLCFALTELSYRALYPVEDLLADPKTGQLRLWRQALYPARAIMPTNPVTVADLRRLVLDRMPALANVWFTPLVPADPAGVSGLYDIQIHVSRTDPCACPGEDRIGEVVRRVLDRYGAHRSLCEDVESVGVLTLLPTQISARVLIEDDADAAQIQAGLLFALGLRLAPEPRRTSLEERLAQGRSTAEIFDGPLMLRGFIDDGQLQPLPRTVAVSDLLKVMAATPKVLLVEGVTVRLAGSSETYGDGKTITVPKGRLLGLLTEPVDERFPICLYQGAVQCRPDPRRVRHLLDGMWRAHRRTYDLWESYRDYYKPPEGRRVDLAAYGSVQDQFPNVYGINAYGLPPDATDKRRAQARQFKGYLMPFDQLMADYFSQLAFVRDLFTPAAGGDRTYAWQSLAGIVPDAASLLSPDYEDGLDAIVKAADPVRERQANILGLLLSLYAERPQPSPGRQGVDGDEPNAALVRAQRDLLVRTVPATRDRGRGFDYRHPVRYGGGAGMEIRCRIALDLIDAAGAMGDDTDGDAIPVNDPTLATLGRPIRPELQEVVNHLFTPVDSLLDDLETTDEPGGSPLAGQSVAVPLLRALSHPSRYRVGFRSNSGGAVVVCRGTDDQWWLVGEHRTASAALTAILRLVYAAGGRRRRRLTIVEHTLLRYAMALTGGDGQDYSFRTSAVLEATREETEDGSWRRQVRLVLRQNTPAHIAIECLFLTRDRMERFLALHARWVEALRQPHPARRATTSLRLQRFLAACRPGAPDGITDGMDAL